MNILNELSKLNGIDFNGKQLVVNNAATKSPAKSKRFSKNVNRRPSPVINKRSSCYEIFQSSSSNHERQKQILFITDSISKGICPKEFNSFISNGNAKIINFPGAISKEILHCLDIYLANSSTDMVVVYVVVNDLINENTHLNIDNLVKNLNSMVQKCNNFGVRNNFISGLLYN